MASESHDAADLLSDLQNLNGESEKRILFEPDFHSPAINDKLPAIWRDVAEVRLDMGFVHLPEAHPPQLRAVADHLGHLADGHLARDNADA